MFPPLLIIKGVTGLGVYHRLLLPVASDGASLASYAYVADQGHEQYCGGPRASGLAVGGPLHLSRKAWPNDRGRRCLRSQRPG